ncbi:hypothetical protein AURDEDRAFT_77464 [Auricularia subglabra TFB-10046 SS5]|uniref:Jacalin-type lectin domain-containing protein n=1 Tax=Auricularia subglabra (strain TFB-10046 / SS5) TaxID=717982 RepID=J0D2D1_AURST|nr:hypothetical protein AURDEDRAFT_77464 [Auricularia subglabra TFB-10046 SS5]
MTHTAPGFAIHNLDDGETVHQRCVLLKGRVFGDEDYITVSTADTHGASTFPDQTWPVCASHFKALLMLSPGANVVTLANGSVKHSLKVNYLPLLQYPPLLLAIMVAKDSPLLMDCPPHKARGISSAHSDLDAAIAKLRMAAYMWQALTAEDLRSKGLGRRSFRLEEEWAVDTVSRDFAQAALEGPMFARNSESIHMRSTAKVHVIRSDKTVKELRDPQVAQQNQNANQRDKLYDYFKAALLEHGGPFDATAQPTVAGLILDSHYSPQQNLILAHAALGGAGDKRSPALGIFGSHTTWAWPRFIEEVTSCLLDTTPSGSRVGNDNEECGTGWQACAVGQGAFLHEVGHAFGCPHTAGIMSRGYAHDWPKVFLPRTSPGVLPRGTLTAVTPVVDGETPNDAVWDLRDALNFTFLRHFRLPSDVRSLSASAASAFPVVEVQHENGVNLRLVIRPHDGVGIARVSFRGAHEEQPTIAAPATSPIEYSFDELERRFGRTETVELKVLGMNGKERIITDVWAMLSRLSFVRVPGTSVVLQKRSVKSRDLEQNENNSSRKYWQWAAMLKTRGSDGKLYRATALDMRVGCILDGGVLFYANGTKVNLGPRWGRGGWERNFGGHASQKIDLPEGVDIAKVEVCGGFELEGYRTHLANGTFGGDRDWDERDKEFMEVLEAGPDERIVGFFGRSDWGRGFEGVQELGIITAPKNAELPDSVYDLPELKNTDGGLGPVSLDVYPGFLY